MALLSVLLAGCSARQMTAPAPVPDRAAAPWSPPSEETFHVRYDGTVSRPAYGVAVDACRALPGVSSVATGATLPGDDRLAARGKDADALGECLDAVPGARVDRMHGDPGEGAGLATFIARCVGAETYVAAPDYVGLPETEATHTKQPTSSRPVDDVRVIGRDGECLAMDLNVCRDRVNLLVANGKVVWAQRF